ncbi:MAG: TolC family protein [Victivallales bacterium]|nr:TolC family protein [Victivallales bacterium]
MKLKPFFRTLSIVALAAVLLSAQGCYTPDPLPEGVYGTSFTGASRKDRRALPEDCTQLSLDMAKHIAKQNNPDYIATRHSMVAASARFYQSLAPYLPTITADYSMHEYKETPMSQGGSGNNSRRYTTKTSGITGRWLIFDGLIRTMDMLAAKHEKSKVEALNRDSLRLLMESVRVSYNNIILAKDRIRISKADEVFNKQLYSETKIKYEAGAVPLTDLLNFEIKMNNASSEVIANEYEFFTARTILAELMGLTEGIIPEDLFPSLSPVRDQFSMDVNIYLDTALQSRPDLKAYREALEAAKYRTAARWGAFLPTVSAQVTFGHQRRDWDTSGRWHFSNQGQNQAFNYGFDAEWVLFDGGSRIFALREAQADLAISKENLAEQWITVVTEVRQSYADRVRRAKQMAIFEKNLALVQKTRDLVEEEYKAGNTSITRLNEAQRDLVIADTNLSTSIIDLENAKARLDASAGMLE